MNKETWAEKRYDNLMDDIIGHMITDEDVCQRFICWVDDKYPNTIQKYVNQWLLEDKDAMKWFDKVLQRMIENTPEPDENLEDR